MAMHFPAYLSYKLGFLVYPFMLLGRKKVGDHIYQVEEETKIFLRENTMDAFILWETFGHKAYEYSGFEIKPQDTVVDIGGHIGIFSVYAARKAYKGLVLSFEPFRENFEILKKNKELNKLANLKINNLAITSKGGYINLNISKSNSGGHSIHGVDTEETLKVSSITLKDIFERNKIKKIDYLKIDTEGAEFDIILNSPKEIFKKISKIVMEYHDFVSERNNHRQIIDYLRKCGFKVSIKGSAFVRKVFKLGIILARRDISDC